MGSLNLNLSADNMQFPIEPFDPWTQQAPILSLLLVYPPKVNHMGKQSATVYENNKNKKVLLRKNVRVDSQVSTVFQAQELQMGYQYP